MILLVDQKPIIRKREPSRLCLIKGDHLVHIEESEALAEILGKILIMNKILILFFSEARVALLAGCHLSLQIRKHEPDS